jgi:hypothetical protein
MIRVLVTEMRIVIIVLYCVNCRSFAGFDMQTQIVKLTFTDVWCAGFAVRRSSLPRHQYVLSSVRYRTHIKTEYVGLLVDVAAHGGDDEVSRYRGPYFEYILI